MNNSQWFVLKTNPKAEKMVAKRLSEIGFEIFFPLHRELKVWKDRKKWSDEVLIKSYVFVHTTEKLRSNVFAVSGIVRYLFVNHKIAIVTPKEIEILKIFCSLDDIKIESKGFSKGDEVEIQVGPLIGLRGIMKKVPSGEKMCIYIEQLGCFATINISKKEVRLIKKAS